MVEYVVAPEVRMVPKVIRPTPPPKPVPKPAPKPAPPRRPKYAWIPRLAKILGILGGLALIGYALYNEYFGGE